MGWLRVRIAIQCCILFASADAIRFDASYVYDGDKQVSSKRGICSLRLAPMTAVFAFEFDRATPSFFATIRNHERPRRQACSSNNSFFIEQLLVRHA